MLCSIYIQHSAIASSTGSAEADREDGQHLEAFDEEDEEEEEEEEEEEQPEFDREELIERYHVSYSFKGKGTLILVYAL